jgi:RNA polymerase II-associated protein 1
MDAAVRIGDVKENEVGKATLPNFPTLEGRSSGFPQPRTRTRISTFKQRQQQKSSQTDVAAKATEKATSKAVISEKVQIDRENKQKIDAMSSEEIVEAQQDIFSTLDPSLIQLLLRRANLDSPNEDSPFGDSPGQRERTRPPEILIEDTSQTATHGAEEVKKSKKSVSFAPTPDDRTNLTQLPDFHEDLPPPEPPADLFPISSPPSEPSARGPEIHFPHRPQPDLDASDPDFLSKLHEKYFPSLPADPSKLAWMAPLPTANSPADRDSPYHPSQRSLAPSQLRFDFRGRLLPPRVARAIPVSKGLHHHGEAPEAAGYTVPELARLARSAVPAQRCIAFQTLGRMLYRLGQGEWGGPQAELSQALWRLFREGRVLDTLHEAESVPEGQGHRGSREYAIEALWLFTKGGWKESWTGR